jgi:hypothetical protein
MVGGGSMQEAPSALRIRGDEDGGDGGLDTLTQVKLKSFSATPPTIRPFGAGLLAWDVEGPGPPAGRVLEWRIGQPARRETGAADREHGLHLGREGRRLLHRTPHHHPSGESWRLRDLQAPPRRGLGRRPRGRIEFKACDAARSDGQGRHSVLRAWQDQFLRDSAQGAGRHARCNLSATSGRSRSSGRRASCRCWILRRRSGLA